MGHWMGSSVPRDGERRAWRGAHNAGRGHVARGSLRESRQNQVALRQSRQVLVPSFQHPGTPLECDSGLVREGWSSAPSVDRTASQRTWGSSGG